MLSNKLKGIFEEIDKKDPNSQRRTNVYRTFLNIAVELKRMREAKGLTQRQLAEELNTSHPTINRWETEGYTGYSVAKLIEIADTLGHRVAITFVPKDELKRSTREFTVPKAVWGDVYLSDELRGFENKSATSARIKVNTGVA